MGTEQVPVELVQGKAVAALEALGATVAAETAAELTELVRANGAEAVTVATELIVMDLEVEWCMPRSPRTHRTHTCPPILLYGQHTNRRT